jgi:hypothetical protein
MRKQYSYIHISPELGAAVATVLTLTGTGVSDVLSDSGTADGSPTVL